ncbi:PEP-CTERM system histidine kinase PrsK [Roseomonas sp. SSH11]|uniref:histidine kinase n=1 Tax=Pararoseomonas baculiformis TaxID=2820812 RepID=A0ABS4ADQ0_9PROT|nr:XrtA/PEP-CTERM system histidine kinase PrsK [Pararoseomonas baculiformis]MBP0445142.1 PEP-CTERM system histidine kinase PrsK [Pararoseomonas baculiformis]
MNGAGAFWPHAVCAAACLAWTLLLLRKGRAGVSTLACAVTACWAASVAIWPDTLLSGVMEAVRVGAWAAVLLSLCRRLPGAARLARGLGAAAAALTVLSVIAVLPSLAPQMEFVAAPLRVALALSVVLLAENLWRNADESARWHVNLPAIALGGLAIFEVVLYAGAALSGSLSPALLDARAGLTGLALALLPLAAARNRRWRTDSPVSREVVFHGATLIVSGGFLLGVGALGGTLRKLGLAWGEAAEAGLLATALMGLVVALSTRSVRSRLRRLVVDHFFADRYDYRREWLRCVAVLSAPGVDPTVRAVRAIADAVDSPAGLLLLRRADEPGPTVAPLEWAGSWNLGSQPITTFNGDLLLAALGDPGRVLEIGEGAADEQAARELRAACGPLALAVPLLHGEHGLLGVVMLAPSRAPFPLDEEVLDLLRTLGREVAMFLAERRSAERLADGERLAAYAQRFAFVSHDLKTACSGLEMLLANAEHNLQDPEFQQDLLLTARASASRMKSLLARLRDEERPSMGARTGSSDPVALLRRLAASRQGRVELQIETSRDAQAVVAMSTDGLESAVTHLLDNALEASPPQAAAILRLGRERGRLVLDIVDRGPGMTDRFVQEVLFRPLSTTKPGGSGIGAWQARNLVRAAGGDLLAITAPGAGTTMRLVLPEATSAPAAAHNLDFPGSGCARTEAVNA